LRAARRSAEAGGGLLGAFGIIPIVMGVLAGSLSVVSLCVAYSNSFVKTTGSDQTPGKTGCDVRYSKRRQNDRQ